MNIATRLVVAAAAVASFCVPSALAQDSSFSELSYDHLRCYKIKDSSNYRAQAELITNELQRQLFPDSPACNIVIRSRELCIPVAKIRQFDSEDKKEAPHLEVKGQSLTNDFLCYNARCKEDKKPRDQGVFDQFGARDVRVEKTVRLCTPTYKIMPEPPKPDLLPVRPNENDEFCAATPDDELIVQIKNQGGSPAAPSRSRVLFSTGDFFDDFTPALGAGAIHEFVVPFPTACFVPDCEFQIIADIDAAVAESHELNNLKAGMCIG